jgi:hypothetical protein
MQYSGTLDHAFRLRLFMRNKKNTQSVDSTVCFGCISAKVSASTTSMAEDEARRVSLGTARKTRLLKRNTQSVVKKRIRPALRSITFLDSHACA